MRRLYLLYKFSTIIYKFIIIIYLFLKSRDEKVDWIIIALPVLTPTNGFLAPVELRCSYGLPVLEDRARLSNIWLRPSPAQYGRAANRLEVMTGGGESAEERASPTRTT